MGTIGQIALAAMLLFFVWRLWPVAKDWMENGPKGSSNDWLTAALLLGGVMGFVWLLVKMT
jgi:hypothetical protein